MKVLKKILLLVVLAGIGFAGFQLYGILHPDSEPAFSNDIIEERITEISELTTLEYFYTNSEVAENNLKLFDWEVPFSDKRLIVKYDGIIKYSTDLSGAKTDLSDERLKITIPHSEIASHEIDEDSWEYLDQKNGLFNTLKPKDDSDIRKDAKKRMEERAKELKLADQADENAIEQITQMVKGIYPELDVEVVVE